MVITQRVLEQLLSRFAVPPPEQGGILGMKNGVIAHYHHDGSCVITDRAVYDPDVETLNQVIRVWAEREIRFAGIVHSHLPGQTTLSEADKAYIFSVFAHLPEQVETLWFPLVLPVEKQIIAYAAKRKNGTVVIRQDDLHIVS